MKNSDLRAKALNTAFIAFGVTNAICLIFFLFGKTKLTNTEYQISLHYLNTTIPKLSIWWLDVLAPLLFFGIHYFILLYKNDKKQFISGGKDGMSYGIFFGSIFSFIILKRTIPLDIAFYYSMVIAFFFACGSYFLINKTYRFVYGVTDGALISTVSTFLVYLVRTEYGLGEILTFSISAGIGLLVANTIIVSTIPLLIGCVERIITIVTTAHWTGPTKTTS